MSNNEEILEKSIDQKIGKWKEDIAEQRAEQNSKLLQLYHYIQCIKEKQKVTV